MCDAARPTHAGYGMEARAAAKVALLRRIRYALRAADLTASVSATQSGFSVHAPYLSVLGAGVALGITDGVRRALRETLPESARILFRHYDGTVYSAVVAYVTLPLAEGKPNA